MLCYVRSTRPQDKTGIVTLVFAQQADMLKSRNHLHVLCRRAWLPTVTFQGRGWAGEGGEGAGAAPGDGILRESTSAHSHFADGEGGGAFGIMPSADGDTAEQGASGIVVLCGLVGEALVWSTPASAPPPQPWALASTEGISDEGGVVVQASNLQNPCRILVGQLPDLLQDGLLPSPAARTVSRPSFLHHL